MLYMLHAVHLDAPRSESEEMFPKLIYLADRGHLALLWVLSLWALCPLCHLCHLQRASHSVDITLFNQRSRVQISPVPLLTLT